MKLSKLAQASILLSVSVLSTTSNAQDKQLSAVVNAGKQINQSAAKSQQKVDKLNDQVQTKLQKFKAVNKEIDGLTVYNQQMQAQINSQLTELTQLAKSMTQVSIMERQISPLMARMITTLDNFVSLDVPFLPKERSQRLANLKTMMVRADIAVSEKFRRVLEAYQVEVNYGRTIEAYSGLLPVDGSERDVDFLRIGRVSFIYQTRDGSKLGLWDKKTNSWQPLPQSYRLAVNKGLRIARKQLAPDLIMVPLALQKLSSQNSTAQANAS